MFLLSVPGRNTLHCMLPLYRAITAAQATSRVLTRAIKDARLEPLQLLTHGPKTFYFLFSHAHESLRAIKDARLETLQSCLVVADRGVATTRACEPWAHSPRPWASKILSTILRRSARRESSRFG